MAGKQYGLKIIHKPSSTVKDEHWFSTEAERDTARGEIKLHSNYTFGIEEKEFATPPDPEPPSKAAKA